MGGVDYGEVGTTVCGAKMRLPTDISPDFKYNRRDDKILREIIRHEATPAAVTCFAEHCAKLSDYGYWFALSTLWVGYTGFSDLELWIRLFSSKRPCRETSLMKPSELKIFRGLPNNFQAYRAHRPNESRWISYTLDPKKAAGFAAHRRVTEVSSYLLQKRDLLALFTRREEFEIIMLDQKKAELLRTIPLLSTRIE